jgi:membrane protein required for colicin V production
MNWVDYFFIAIIGISVIVGLLRGFTREALSLAGWIVAIWITVTYADKLQALLVPHVSSPTMRLALAVIILFLLTMIVAAMLSYLFLQLIEMSGLSGTDRLIGVVFGFLRGYAVIVGLVLLGGLTDFPQHGSWRHSHLMHYFQSGAVWLRNFLPPEVAANIRY